MSQGPPPSAAGPAPPYNPYTAAYSANAASGQAQSTWASNWQHYYAQNGVPYAPSHASQLYGNQHASTPTSHYPNTSRWQQNSQYYPQNTTSQAGASYAYVSPPTRPQVADTAIQTEEPPEDDYEHWDTVFKTFLVEAHLTETSKAFESDMLVLSPDWEATGVYRALGNLVKRLPDLADKRDEIRRGKQVDQEDVEMRDEQGNADDLNKRKLAYVSTRLAPGEVARTPTTVIKSISQLLARNRARNNASNRAEFLYNLNERRKHVDPTIELSSCARTDARPIDRDAQMKYDIAKNSDGPLSRTRAKRPAGPEENTDNRRVRLKLDHEPVQVKEEDEEGTASRYPALDDRLQNIETHFGVRYVPSPPRTLLSRLKFLEDHIMKLEKEYPPWAALWFNQPNRGWPPPPRTTPLIVPYDLRHIKPSTATPPTTDSGPLPKATSPSPVPSLVKEEDSTEITSLSSTRAKGKTKSTKKQSSLHRAVMEKLEVRKALEDYRSGS
ncbi:hypothetical protein BKA70DRAFT_1528805 [Coprinopsis sp. MPI-PUGE-AT-0042]|nr:hypothetical protein BKA70DRAFT_1528805 [Coprinopsis sp. MPI-PUGE-AT-0042]